ncbi:MAG: AmmeMemoRadiSam system protein B [Treponema sp.]|jgi:AmmeMemoRadiSam system protein B|nr:AmmeMemoRadiSam system protein B [Treponema sp.]
MKVRGMALPQGWYPHSADGINAFLENCSAGNSKVLINAHAALAPHAGWYYSGRTAACSVSALDRLAETIVVIGGHLSGGSPFLFAEEDGAETPFGPMYIDKELRESLKDKTNSASDSYRDNTVEVLLPMVRYFFPKARLLWARFPADLGAFDAGKMLAASAQDLGRSIAVIGSTDLTHYGDNYGFSPKGSGPPALKWVREENDANFIKAVLSGDPARVLERAEKDFSSCSAGAVLGAMGFAEAYIPARSKRQAKAELLEYSTSADVSEGGIPDSFVGYASIVF